MIRPIGKMFKDKRGFLLAEETLKIILAVIAIGFLAFLLFSLYNSGKKSQDLEFAEESMDFLLEGINAERNESEIFNPKGWVIVSWPMDSGGEIPQSCTNLGWESCVCILKDNNWFRKTIPDNPLMDDEIENLRKNSNEGACRENPRELLIEEPIKISNPPITLLVDYENKIIRKTD